MNRIDNNGFLRQRDRFASTLQRRTNHLEVLDNQGESGREEHDLTLRRHEGEELFDNGGEFGRKEFVGFVHDKHRAAAQICDSLSSEIENSTRGTNENVNRLSQPHDVVSQRRSSRRYHDLSARVFSERLAHLGSLEGEFTGRDEEEGLDFGNFRVDAFESRDDERGSLSGSVLRSGEDIPSRQCDRDRFFLNR